jgi:hypothetical protein
MTPRVNDSGREAVASGQWTPRQQGKDQRSYSMGDQRRTSMTPLVFLGGIKVSIPPLLPHRPPM